MQHNVGSGGENSKKEHQAATALPTFQRNNVTSTSLAGTGGADQDQIHLFQLGAYDLLAIDVNPDSALSPKPLKVLSMQEWYHLFVAPMDLALSHQHCFIKKGRIQALF